MASASSTSSTTSTALVSLAPRASATLGDRMYHVAGNLGALLPSKEAVMAAASHLGTSWSNDLICLSALYFGSYCVPESVMAAIPLLSPAAQLAAAGIALNGVHRTVSNVSQELHAPTSGPGKFVKELNEASRAGGATHVARTMGGALFGGMSAAAKVELVDPTVADIARRAAPAGHEIKQLTGQLRNLFWTGLGVGTGLIACWFGSRIAYNYLEKYMNKPKLDYTHKKAQSNGTLGTLSRQITVAPETRTRLNTFLRTNLKMKESIYNEKSGALYRNLALYGPNGSGKRMFAQEMAHFARMDFYEIQWSAFNKFSADGAAVQAIDRFFKQDMHASPNGAVIYIDNAQLLFSDMRPSVGSGLTHATQVIDALIAHTEVRSNKYMVIFGMTSKPTLSRDILPIVDDIVEITLPGLVERKAILKTYRDLYFKQSIVQESIMDGVRQYLQDTDLDKIAAKLDKASASDIESFMKTLKIEAELPVSDGLTPELISSLLDRMVSRYDDLANFDIYEIPTSHPTR